MMSDHLRLEVAAAFTRGRSLGSGEPVPGCGCPQCTGLPEEHPARTSRRLGFSSYTAGRGNEDPRAAWGDLVQRARSVDLLDVVDRLGCGTPQRRGKRLAVHCPLHEDASPSCLIDVEKGLWYCFPCGAGGDVIELYRRARRLTFGGAVNELVGQSPGRAERRP